MRRFLVLALILVVGLIAGCAGQVPTFTLTVRSTVGGSLSTPSIHICNEGSVVDIQAPIEEGLRFVSWTGDVATIADTNAASTTSTMNEDCTITANFLNIYTDAGKAIGIDVNQKFIIALESNPTTGYSWQESLDETMVELLKSEYELGEDAQKGVAGAGGNDLFWFKTLKKGLTKITLVYKRPWETEIAEQKVFTIIVK